MTAPAPSSHHDAGLDALRAVAALGVLVTHVGYFSSWYTLYAVGPVVAHLAVAVPIFFALSGYLVGGPFVTALLDGRPMPGLGRYAVRRAARILPVFWVAVLICALLTRQDPAVPWWRWFTQALLVDVWFGTAPQGLGHIWSLTMEATFYVALPLLVVLIRLALRGRATPRRVQVAIGVLVAIGVIWSGLSTTLLEPAYEVTFWWPFPYLAWFGVGLLVASVAHSPEATALSRLLVRLGRERDACWVMAGAVFVIACTPVTGPVALVLSTAQQQTVKLVLHAVVALLLLLPLTLGRRDTPPSTPVRWLGRLGLVSYGIFCVHQVLLVIIADLFGWEPFEAPGLALLGLTLVSTIALSVVLYLVVERPVQRWARARTTGTSQPTATITSS